MHLIYRQPEPLPEFRAGYATLLPGYRVKLADTVNFNFCGHKYVRTVI